MSALGTIRSALVAAGITEDIYYEMSEAGANRPYIVLLNDGTDPLSTKSGSAKTDRIQVRVLCFADRYETGSGIKGAYNLGQEVRTAIDFTQESTHEIYFQSEMSDSLKTGNNRAYMVEQTYWVWNYN